MHGLDPRPLLQILVGLHWFWSSISSVSLKCRIFHLHLIPPPPFASLTLIRCKPPPPLFVAEVVAVLSVFLEGGLGCGPGKCMGLWALDAGYVWTSSPCFSLGL